MSNARGRSTRSALLRTTSELVREVGYAQTTIRAVAQAAGIAEGTIYRHFPDKVSLLMAVVTEQQEPIVQWLAELPARAGQGDLAVVLGECLERLVEMRQNVLPLELAMLTDPDLAAERARIVASRSADDPPQLLAAYLAAEQRLGRLRADVAPGEAAVLVLALLFGLSAAPPGLPAVLEVPTIKRAVELLLQGLAP